MPAEGDWERIGRDDPYYGVLSTDQYHADQLSPESKAQFFRTGEQHFERVLATVLRLQPNLSTRRALDFGCGVARVTIPMSRNFDEVVGVDVSQSMLAEAKKNISAQGDGARVQLASAADGRFDFIHAHIVFQHIPRARGMELFRDLLGRLNPGGVAMIQFHYRRDVPWFRKAANFWRSRVRLVHKVGNLLQGRPWSFPLIMMVCYEVSELLLESQRAGIASVHVEVLPRISGFSGGLFYFINDRDAARSLI